MASDTLVSRKNAEKGYGDYTFKLAAIGGF
jgi:hypothetical protein